METWFAHRELYPTRKLARWKLLAEGLLMPPVAAANADRLARGAMQPLHPVSVALATCRETRGRAVACAHRRDLLEPLRPLPFAGDASAAATVEWHRAACAAALDDMLAAANIPPEEPIAPPPRDRAAAGYCPRCERCVRAGIETCIDCGGIPIVVFPAAAAAPDAAANPGPTP
jgi:hypothetical protein